MALTSQAPGAVRIAAEPAPPAVDQLLPQVARVLAREGRPHADVRVMSTHARTWSTVWEIGSGDDRYILKWLPRRAERERELAELTRRVFVSEPSIRTPRVASNPTADTFLVEKLPGVPLHAVCTQPPVLGIHRWLDSRRVLLERVGGWLRQFHAAGRQTATAPLSGVKAYALNREQAFTAFDRVLVDEFLRRLDEAVAASPVRVHGDFTPHNVLVSGTSVSVIDLAGINEMEYETPAFDAAAMIVGLQETWRRRGRNYLRFFSSPVDAMAAAFLGASGVQADDDTLPLCYAVRHLQRIHGLMRATSRVPGPRNWHVRQVRLALEHPEQLPWRGGRT